MNTVIIIDSSCDLPLQFIEENKIPALGLICHLDGEDHVDDFGKTLTYEYFYKRIREGSMPTTSQINVYRFEELFKKYVKEGKAIIYLAMSSKISGCFNSATVAKKLVEEEFKQADITVIDTKSASIGEGLLVYNAYEMLKNGATKEEIVSWVEENKLNVQLWFVVEDLMHLKKGGRLSAAKANIGTLLQMKPMLCVDKEGNLKNTNNIRGRKKAIKSLFDRFEENMVLDENSVIAISHGDCFEDALYLKDIIIEKYKVKKVIINHVGPVIGSHTGAGMISLCFIGKHRVI
ncbi:DegV family protein [Clostridium ganghwense]|uniref:DegV family protein n=1 Tax=Clostridium ganghwense TaxID=312089 RepID=A0ABT4CSR3_9CLOT|nr:DegV family protein [Clostridium ganghwense]MCY6372084.1 DegV family protein [Clostridium ganghwense]